MKMTIHLTAKEVENIVRDYVAKSTTIAPNSIISKIDFKVRTTTAGDARDSWEVRDFDGVDITMAGPNER